MMDKVQSRDPIRICCILDDRAGHTFQVEGILEALSRRVPIQIHRHSLDEPSSTLRDFHPELVIGAGRKTHWKLALAKFWHHTPAVVIMKPSLPTFLFSLCVIPKHDNPPSRENIFPVRFAPTTITRPSPHRKRKVQQIALIGGPSSHFVWDIDSIIHRLRELDSGPGFEILTSRRTPLESAKALEACGRVILPSQISRDQYESLLESATRIVLTPDSVSMLSDALATDACIFSVPLRKKTSKVADYFDEACLQTQMNTGVKNDPITEADRIADHMLQRFFI